MNNHAKYSGDLIEDSRSYLMTAVFGKTNSYAYPLAINIARQAAKYDEFMVGKTLTHIACFEKNVAGAEKAAVLIKCILGWKGSMVLVNGRVLNDYWMGSMVLHCYLKGASCNDQRAHCNVIVDSPYKDAFEEMNLLPDGVHEVASKYILPCKMIIGEYRQVKFHPCHPSAIEDLMQAEAINMGVDFCPMFDVTGFKPASSA